MGKAKKDLLTKAPWRGEYEDDSNKFKDAKLKVTSDSGGTSTMHVPGKKKTSKYDNLDDDDESLQIDPQLRYSFQRNFQFLQRVFSIDTIVKPLPPAMAYNVSRNLNFFTRIFTQFFGKFDFNPEGIAGAQKSLGLGQEEKARRVR
ncbi:hypothetical protein Pint_07501 [Pistacia integerrima]|uniref:Uncharacterized protein n=1 Tax=Pistacia integerrima TaxID=434235 RepID=A0ACC0XZF3_9ROSI|nr:hypothetical protein Pint_07501 [Pistacia integerrima]